MGCSRAVLTYFSLHVSTNFSSWVSAISTHITLPPTRDASWFCLMTIVSPLPRRECMPVSSVYSLPTAPVLITYTKYLSVLISCSCSVGKDGCGGLGRLLKDRLYTKRSSSELTHSHGRPHPRVIRIGGSRANSATGVAVSAVDRAGAARRSGVSRWASHGRLLATLLEI